MTIKNYKNRGNTKYIGNHSKWHIIIFVIIIYAVYAVKKLKPDKFFMGKPSQNNTVCHSNTVAQRCSAATRFFGQ